MHISILTLFPEMVIPFITKSILKRAQEKKAVTIEIINLRDFALDSYGTVDSRPYGGGAGMVLRADVLAAAITSIKNEILKQDLRIGGQVQDDSVKTILTSAKGTKYNQTKAQELSKLQHLVIIAGHYEGVDARAMNYVDEEISIGDFVLTGGEIPAVAIVDSVVRLLPGVLKKEEATAEESFFHVALDELMSIVGKTEILTTLKDRNITSVQLLEYPHYTRPEDIDGAGVPEVLLSGNHAEIYKWRIQSAYEETKKKRPDLLAIDTK